MSPNYQKTTVKTTVKPLKFPFPAPQRRNRAGTGKSNPLARTYIGVRGPNAPTTSKPTKITVIPPLGVELKSKITALSHRLSGSGSDYTHLRTLHPPPTTVLKPIDLLTLLLSFNPLPLRRFDLRSLRNTASACVLLAHGQVHDEGADHGRQRHRQLTPAQRGRTSIGTGHRVSNPYARTPPSSSSSRRQTEYRGRALAFYSSHRRGGCLYAFTPL